MAILPVVYSLTLPYSGPQQRVIDLAAAANNGNDTTVETITLSLSRAQPCTPTGFYRDNTNLTAARIGGALTGTLDATGCNIGVYYGPGETALSAARKSPAPTTSGSWSTARRSTWATARSTTSVRTR